MISDVSSGPCNWMFFLWVEVCWIRELTIVILVVECFLGSLANLDEVGNVLSVGEVLVEVILEVLDEIHMLLNEIISSNSWEREGIIIELPGVDENSWVLSLLLKLSIDLHGIVVMCSIASSREIVKLNVELFLRNIDGWLATSSHFSLNE